MTINTRFNVGDQVMYNSECYKVVRIVIIDSFIYYDIKRNGHTLIKVDEDDLQLPV